MNNQSKEELEAYWTGYSNGVRIGKKIGYEIVLDLLEKMKILSFNPPNNMIDYLRSIEMMAITSDEKEIKKYQEHESMIK